MLHTPFFTSLTDTMMQSHPSDMMSQSATEEIPAIYETQKFLLCLQLTKIISQYFYLFSKIHIILIHPSMNTR
jgi:hypothetical protein